MGMKKAQDGQNANGKNQSEDEVGLESRLKETTEAISEGWDGDPENPYNWPVRRKVLQVLMLASAAFTT